MCKISSYVVAATVLLALALCPVTARADSTSFDLTVAPTSPALAVLPGPYISVAVDLTSSTTADITFMSYTQGAFTYLMGDGKSVGLNVNASMFSASIITDAGFFGNGALIGGIPAGQGAAQFDSLPGTFNFWISKNEDNGGYNGLVNKIEFTITASGVNWLHASDVLAPNSGGLDAASHITVDDGSCRPTQSCVTGYGTTQPVPEPPVNALLACSALLFGGFFLRRPLWS